MTQEQSKTSLAEAPEQDAYFTFVVAGGGIAGVTCCETLAICCPNESILLITESNVIKTIANLEPVARYLYKFNVQERNINALSSGQNVASGGLPPAIVTIVDQLVAIDSIAKRLTTVAKRSIKYQYLCLCTGATPHLILSNHQSRVIGIRDTDSVLEFQKRLKNARRLLLVGNGGIASELAHELRNVEVHWVVKDTHIASTFVDPGAAHFFQESLKKRLEPKNTAITTLANNEDTTIEAAAAVKRLRYAEHLLTTENETSLKRGGAALGPDWHRNFTLNGSNNPSSSIIMHYKAQVQEIEMTKDEKKNCKDDNDDGDSSLLVTLSTGEKIQCDFIVSATGVEPQHNYTCKPQLVLAADGGIAVDEMMRTNLHQIYAAGDVCTAQWEPAKHWFQMRLWTQARQMGSMAGRSMAAAFSGDEIYQDFAFELFGHVTKLFGYEMVLLGRYNAQGLGQDYELLIRTTPGKEYIKFVLQGGRLRGAILIGNSELAETCENLILNGIDLTPYGDDILNPDIDIEDFFD